MRRADVKHGVEYAVRRGSYGGVARVLVIGEMTVVSPNGRRSERGLEGKLIEGDYTAGYPAEPIKRSKTGFVRPRDVMHEWTVEAENKAARATAAKARKAAAEADEAERRDLDKRIVALLALPSGIAIDVYQYDGYRRASRIEVDRDVLGQLVDAAERAAALALHGLTD